MKQLLALTILCLALAGCGSDQPFKRGSRDGAGGGSNGGSSKPGDGGAKPTPSLNKEYFETALRSEFESDCKRCHGNPAASFEMAVKLVIPGHADRSPLYLLATGSGHKKVWPVDSAKAEALASWINNPETAVEPPAEPVAPVEPPATVLDKGFFDANLLPSFVKSCDHCHDNPAPTYEEAVLLVVPGDISKSILYLLPAGGVMSDGDKHPAKWKVGSAEAAVLESWINGAKL